MALSTSTIGYLGPTQPNAPRDLGQLGAFVSQFALQFAQEFLQLWTVLRDSMESFFGSGLEFTQTLIEIFADIVNNHPAINTLVLIPQIGTCAQGCELVKSFLNYLQWMKPGPADRLGRDTQRRLEIGWGTLQLTANIIQPASDPTNPFDKPWELSGLVGCVNNLPDCSAGTEPYDPAKHDQAFLIVRIKDQGKCFLLGCGDIIIAARADHCLICGSTDKINEILKWIEQAIAALRQQPQDRLGRDKLIVTYGFTNESAAQTDAALQAIKDRFGNSAIPILVWRLLPNGTVEYICIGNCSGFTDDQLRQMACKEATGSANCSAQPWGSPSSSQDSKQNSTAMGSNPPPPPSDLCPSGQVCLQEVRNR
jgi:hypothetical protein